MDIQFIKARLLAFKESLQSKSSHEKGKHASSSVASDFNSVLVAISNTFPAAESALPSEIQPHSIADGLSEVTFLDLEIKVNQALSIIQVLESGS